MPEKAQNTTVKQGHARPKFCVTGTKITKITAALSYIVYISKRRTTAMHALGKSRNVERNAAAYVGMYEMKC